MNIEFHTIRDFFGPGCGGETGIIIQKLCNPQIISFDNVPLSYDLFWFRIQVPRFKSLLTLRLGTLVVLNSAFFYLIKKNTP